MKKHITFVQPNSEVSLEARETSSFYVQTGNAIFLTYERKDVSMENPLSHFNPHKKNLKDLAQSKVSVGS